MKRNFYIHRRRARGFTIIELSIVIIVIAIIGYKVWPKFFSTSSYQAAYFYNDVLLSLRYAQKLAVASGCQIQATFTSTTLTLNKLSSCTSGTFTTDIRDPALGSSTYVKTAPGSVTMSSTVNPIHWDGLGLCYNSSNVVSNVTVTVGSKTITIVGQTGFVYDPTT